MKRSVYLHNVTLLRYLNAGLLTAWRILRNLNRQSTHELELIRELPLSEFATTRWCVEVTPYPQKKFSWGWSPIARKTPSYQGLLTLSLWDSETVITNCHKLCYFTYCKRLLLQYCRGSSGGVWLQGCMLTYRKLMVSPHNDNWAKDTTIISAYDRDAGERSTTTTSATFSIIWQKRPFPLARTILFWSTLRFGSGAACGITNTHLNA